MLSPARQKPAGKEVRWTGNTSLETDRAFYSCPGRETAGKGGRKDRSQGGGFKDEPSAQGLGPCGRGHLWASSQMPGETDPGLPRFPAPHPAGNGGLDDARSCPTPRHAPPRAADCLQNLLHARDLMARHRLDERAGNYRHSQARAWPCTTEP